MLLKNIGLLIEEYNMDESADLVSEHLLKYGLKVFLSFEDIKNLNTLETFVFTDKRDSADMIKGAGFGFATYYNVNSRKEIFNDALYNVDSICSLSDMQINRMLLRFLNIPWVILETERCIVREIKEDDVDTLYKIFNRESGEEGDRDSDNSLYDDPLKEEAYTRDYIKYQYRFFEYGIWMIVDKDSRQIIGRAGLCNREGYEDVELGYVIAPKYRNSGYAYEVCTGILDYARDYMKLNNINAFVREDNLKSINLLNKLGFFYYKDVIIDKLIYRMYKKVL